MESRKCGNCSGEDVIRLGFKHGKQRWKCKGCGKTWNGEAVGENQRVDPLLRLMRRSLKAAVEGEPEAVADFRKMRAGRPASFMKAYRELEREDAAKRKSLLPVGGEDEAPLVEESTESLLRLISDLNLEYTARHGIPVRAAE